ncbi:MAG: putative rRNA maturation factor, partial [Francisellaceae bacterium]
KSLEAHWAHIFIHGILHLYGYDHVTEKDANIMEPIEIEILQQLGFDDPYETTEKE